MLEILILLVQDCFVSEDDRANHMSENLWTTKFILKKSNKAILTINDRPYGLHICIYFVMV